MINKILDWHNISYTQSGNELIMTCPFCSKQNHLYVNAQYGQFDCKKCGEQGSFEKLQETFEPVDYSKFGLDDRQDELLDNINSDENTYQKILQIRKLHKKFIKMFSIGCYIEQTKTSTDEVISFPYFKNQQLVLLKYLRNPWIHSERSFMFTPVGMPVQERPFFGEQLLDFSLPYIVLTEGEWDTVALRQYGVRNSVSVPTGTSCIPNLKANEHLLKRFKKIYIQFDADKSGQDAAIKAIELLKSYNVRNVILPKKDANDCIKAGVTKETIQQCFRGYVDRSAHIGGAKELFEDYENQIKEPVIPLGIKKLDNRMVFALHAFTIILGWPGHGKTTIALNILTRQFLLHKACFLALFETRAKGIVNTLAPILRETDLTKVKAITDKYLYYIRKPTCPYDPLTLEQDIRYAVETYGTQMIVIDNPHKFLPVSRDDRLVHEQFITRLCSWCEELPVHIILVTHSRKASNSTFGKPRVTEQDIKSTAKYAQEADNILLVHREQRGEMTIEIAKNREGGHIEEFKMYFTPESGYKRLVGNMPKELKEEREAKQGISEELEL